MDSSSSTHIFYFRFCFSKYWFDSITIIILYGTMLFNSINFLCTRLCLKRTHVNVYVRACVCVCLWHHQLFTFIQKWFFEIQCTTFVVRLLVPRHRCLLKGNRAIKKNNWTHIIWDKHRTKKMRTQVMYLLSIIPFKYLYPLVPSLSFVFFLPAFPLTSSLASVPNFVFIDVYALHTLRFRQSPCLQAEGRPFWSIAFHT